MKSKNILKNSDLRSMSVEALGDLLIEQRKSLFVLKIDPITLDVKNFMLPKLHRRNIARILTILKEKKEVIA